MLFPGQLLLELRVFSSSPSPTEEPFWDDKDRSGEVKYWEFQAVGKFIPGTREHRAWGCSNSSPLSVE